MSMASCRVWNVLTRCPVGSRTVVMKRLPVLVSTSRIPSTPSPSCKHMSMNGPVNARNYKMFEEDPAK